MLDLKAIRKQYDAIWMPCEHRINVGCIGCENDRLMAFDEHIEPMLVALERIDKLCDEREAEIFERTYIKQSGHLNTLTLRAAINGKPDPFENDNETTKNEASHE